MAVGLLMVRRRSFLLIEPLRPVSGVDDVDEVNAARPSVLYAAMGPWGSSVASFELKRRPTAPAVGRPGSGA